MRFLTAGESHGRGVLALIEGIPAGLSVSEEQINVLLERRQKGYGRGPRMALEKDRVTVLSGIRGSKTTGAPITLWVGNKDWENKQGLMQPFGPLQGEPIRRPRPGHADLAGAMKYGIYDMRDVFERASARETAARCAAGGLVLTLLSELGMSVAGFVTALGGVIADVPDVSLTEIISLRDASEVMCPDENASRRMMEEIDRAKADGDTLGGVFEVRATGVPPGLGTYVQWDRRLDGLLAQAIMSIQGIKAVEIGAGICSSAMRGSLCHDAIMPAASGWLPYLRASNNAGGLEGGMTNGETLVVRGYMKPIATTRRGLPSVDLDNGQACVSHYERSDVCAVPAASVVGEAAVALVIAQAVLDKFAKDSMRELKQSFGHYLECIREFGKKRDER